ncbi:SDR family oxidoreductase [Lyngbya confervoides]|uniref:SDR family oxidoreductase n=1 Tax=Lyngbya confervoides BDU141951 TaxID=1574623 RepID=A0ABD4T3S3_9CYAN|nr:SDR family oxidoreductase [Lyngbya confervoides]MCM1983255.1 SDR family oxidoreductase [Lyngbya confervoides BDU141951]
MTQVLVTGATGRTGALVVKKLQNCEQPDGNRSLTVIGFARNREKVQSMFGSTEGFVYGDITDPGSLAPAMDQCDALIIVTSAKPQISPPTSPDTPALCTFEPGGSPEEVDYQGQVNQINCAKEAGIQQIILVGSMGGTNEQHPLNRFGNILIWKRKAEQYLIDSGLDYTIVRAGGLIDEAGGERELIVGKHDTLLTNPPKGIATTIPRSDVAEVVVQALFHPEARNKAFDLIAMPPGQASYSQDFHALFSQTMPGL